MRKKENKKEKKIVESEYVMSPINTPMVNYKTYMMNKNEKILNFFMAFFAGGFIGLIFYGGQFKDTDGVATIATMISNVLIFCVVGGITTKIYFPIRKKQLQEKRKLELTVQFRSFLEAISVSLSSGMNILDALDSVKGDLEIQYSEKSYIVQEVTEIINGMKHNIRIETMMESFGERSEIEDIKNFAIVFSVANRSGGDINTIIRRTNKIISEKIEIKQEIETAVASNKSQFTIMMFMPVVIILLLRFMGSSFAEGFSTPLGVIGITISIGIFIGAYFLGQKILDIKE